MNLRRLSFLRYVAGRHPRAALGADLALLAIAAFGCSGVSSTSSPGPTTGRPMMDAPDAAPPLATPPPTSAPEQRSSISSTSQRTSSVLSDSGTISRRELRQYLGLGAHQFIQQVRVRAVFRRGKFWGWRILSYSAPGPVRPGDIVLRVNGQSLERPEQFIAVWNSIEVQPELRVELVRQGKPLQLGFPIVD